MVCHKHPFSELQNQYFYLDIGPNNMYDMFCYCDMRLYSTYTYMYIVFFIYFGYHYIVI